MRENDFYILTPIVTLTFRPQICFPQLLLSWRYVSTKLEILRLSSFEYSLNRKHGTD